MFDLHVGRLVNY